jgi:hypothetical protein
MSVEYFPETYSLLPLKVPVNPLFGSKVICPNVLLIAPLLVISQVPLRIGGVVVTGSL